MRLDRECTEAEEQVRLAATEKRAAAEQPGRRRTPIAASASLSTRVM